MSCNPVMTITAVGTAAVLLITLGTKPTPLLIWNASQSVPIGLYSVGSSDQLVVAHLVLVMPPEPLASFLDERGYLPRGVPLMKRVLALRGQSVCRSDLIIAVDGVDVGMARERDHRGRQLPAWAGCRVIEDGEVFLMNWDEPASLDGRYFGPIHTSAVVGRAHPVWTFEQR
jgi:conjugative transfer signal peptidase TraF